MDYHQRDPQSSPLWDLLSARLSRQVALWVFVSLVLIEAIVLIPSVWQRRQELIEQLATIQGAQLTWILSDRGFGDRPISEEALLSPLRNTVGDELTGLAGGELYRQDLSVGTFGLAPSPSVLPMMRPDARAVTAPAMLVDLRHRDRHYYSIWQIELAEGAHTLVLLHDEALIRRSLLRFVLQVIGLVIIIALFITAATIVVVGQMVITPVLKLRHDLQQAGEVAGQRQQPQFTARATQDELGDVVMAFQQMFDRVSRAIRDRQQAQQALLMAKRDAEAANQAKSAFLANISRELRPPIDRIVADAERLQGEAEAREQSDLVPGLQHIQKEGQKLLGVVDNVLNR